MGVSSRLFQVLLPSLCPILCSVCPCLQLLPYSSNKPSVPSIPHHLMLQPLGQVWGMQVDGSKFQHNHSPSSWVTWPHSTAESAMCGQWRLSTLHVGKNHFHHHRKDGPALAHTVESHKTISLRLSGSPPASQDWWSGPRSTTSAWSSHTLLVPHLTWPASPSSLTPW